MVPLSDLESRACCILIAAGHCGVPLDDLRAELRRDGVPEAVWRPLWNALGLLVRVEGEDDAGQFYVTFPAGVVGFVPRKKGYVLPRVAGGSVA